jgi:hypothetical protein
VSVCPDAQIISTEAVCIVLASVLPLTTCAFGQNLLKIPQSVPRSNDHKLGLVKTVRLIVFTSIV